jgi:tetratricopeptide (TPR) repeat protein
MSKTNFERLKRNIDGLLSFNSFLSTSSQKNVAESFILGIDRNHPALVAVIFEIDVDPSMKTSSPFASVANLSDMREAEVLFSIQTVFRIGDMQQFEDGIWHVQLKMTLDEDKQLRELTEYNRRQCFTDPLNDWELGVTPEEETLIRKRLAGCINMAKFCYVLGCMGQQETCAEIAVAKYKEHFGTNPDDFIYKLSCFMLITDVAYASLQEADIERYVQEFESILVQSPPSDKKQLATLYTILARHSKQYDRAVDYQLRAFNLFQELSCMTHEDLICHYNAVGDIHFKGKQFYDALSSYKRAWQLSVELQLPTHPLLSKCCLNIGKVYHQLGDYERAWEHQKQSLDISYKSLPATHHEILNLHTTCSMTLLFLQRYPEAIQHLEKAMEIVRSRTGHEPVIDIYNEILDNLRS